jgi:hypothetical protein
MSNTPEDYVLDLNTSILKQRVDGNNTVEFAVHYLATNSDSGELIANITSSFKFTGTEGIVADTTWSDFGNVKYGVSNWSRSDYVDISEYRGLTLKITLLNNAYYGLVFYDENKTAKKDDGWYYADSSATAGYVHVVEIKIPKTATYVRTTYYYENGAYADSVTAKPFSARIYKSTQENITSLFKFTGTEGIVADTTWSDFGNIKYGVSNWTRSDYVDISEYQGKTLKITMPNSASYGLVFYTEKSQSADSTAAGWSYKIGTGTAGFVHVVEIIIPETAVYVRTTYYYEKGAYADSVTTTPFSAVVLLGEQTEVQ